VQRCRTILAKLASLGSESADMLDRMTISHLVEDVVQPQRYFGVDVGIERSGTGEEPVCRRNPGILYGLGNLVENAIDFAKARIRIDLYWDAMVVRITIEDDGPGFRPEVLARLGDPYISTKGPDRRAKSDEGGLGLGLFIAKTLLERSGASVAVANATPPLTGARIVVSWPRASFETVTADVSAVTNQGDEALAIQAYIHGKPRVNP
jgi:two-component system sensor histidine kinase RegB